MKGYSQQLQFIHDDGLFNISFNFACRDFNAKLKLYAVIKIREKFKTTQLAKFPIMSRHKIACRDIVNLWWGQVIPWLRQQIFSLCIMMSRQLPLGGIALVATSAFSFLQY